MPKEKISDDVNDGWHVELSWKRDDLADGGTSGHVALASVNVHSPFEFPEVFSPGHWEAAVPFDGWRINLTEDGIDQLMVALRKAKRQAYPQPDDQVSVTTTGTVTYPVSPAS